MALMALSMLANALVAFADVDTLTLLIPNEDVVMSLRSRLSVLPVPLRNPIATEKLIVLPLVFFVYSMKKDVHLKGGKHLIYDQNFRLQLRRDRKGQTHKHTAGILFHRGIEKLFNFGERHDLIGGELTNPTAVDRALGGRSRHHVRRDRRHAAHRHRGRL